MSCVIPHVLTLARFLTDTNSQVRKTSQAALLVLLEQGLVDTNDVVDQVRVFKVMDMLSKPAPCLCVGVPSPHSAH